MFMVRHGHGQPHLARSLGSERALTKLRFRQQPHKFRVDEQLLTADRTLLEEADFDELLQVNGRGLPLAMPASTRLPIRQ